MPRSSTAPLLHHLGAAGTAGSLVGLGMGAADGLGISASYGATHGGATLPGELYLHALALDAGLFLLIGLALGALWWLVPFSIAPSRQAGRVLILLRMRGGLAGATAARCWSGLAVIVLGAAGSVLLAHHFLTAYQNRFLAAVALTIVFFGYAGLLWGVHRTLAHHLTGPLARGLARWPWTVWLAGPRGPLLLTALAAAGALLYVPRRFAETWDALPLERPLWFLGGCAALWLGTDLLLRLRGTARTVLPVATLLGLLALGSTSVAAFGNDRQDRRVARAIHNYGVVSASVLEPVAQLTDQDDDGFPDHFGGGDCDDDNAAINPAARELPGNGIDENCLGGDLRLTGKLRRTIRPVPPRPRPRARPLRRRWNVLLVIIDAMRADRAGWAGYHRPLTPHLDRLAAVSQRFQRAYAPSNKTPSSLPALLSGRYTSELHRTYGHFNAIYPSNEMLAERFQAAGWETLASVSHFSLRPGYGLAQGFRHWEVTDARTSEQMERLVTSPRVTDRAIAQLDAWQSAHGPAAPAAARRPFFLFAHYFDPHKHYLAHPGVPSLGDRPVDRYDGELRFTDGHVGRLLDHLRAKGLLQDTVVVITADHGEAFGEHGYAFHGRDLHEHQLRVPLLLYVPGLASRDRAAPVSLLDLGRTLLDLVGLAQPKDLQGLSLVPWLRNARPLPERAIYAEMPVGPLNPRRRALIVGRYKLIHDVRSNLLRIFDVVADPGEQHDLARRDPALRKRLRQTYEAFVALRLRVRRPTGMD